MSIYTNCQKYSLRLAYLKKYFKYGVQRFEFSNKSFRKDAELFFNCRVAISIPLSDVPTKFC